MHVLHENKEIEPWVAESLHEASADTLVLFQTDSIPLHAVVRELTFLWCKPSGRERLIGQQVNADDCDADCDNSLNDEQPGI